MMGAWRRADRALEALQQPHTGMRSTAAMHDGAALSKSMEDRRCKCTCILRRSMIFAPHSKLVLTRNLKTILVDLLADPRPGIGARHSRTPPVARNGRRVARRSPPLEKLGEQPASRGAARRNARESAGVAVGRIARPCLEHSRSRRLSLPRTAPASSGSYQGLAQVEQPEAQPRHQRVAKQSRKRAAPARDTWLPRQTPPT